MPKEEVNLDVLDLYKPNKKGTDLNYTPSNLSNSLNQTTSGSSFTSILPKFGVCIFIIIYDII